MADIGEAIDDAAPRYELKPKTTGFRFECFREFELQKAERAKEAGGAVVPHVEPLWKPNDPRWALRPPYGFRAYTLKWGGGCMYCGDHIPAGTFALYSAKMQSVAHRECHADYDCEVPAGGVEPRKPSPSDRFGNR